MSNNRTFALSIFNSFILSVVLASCGSLYKIEGNSSVTSLDGKMLFLKTLQNGEWMVVDSAEVVHGLFSMSGDVDSVRMVTLYMDDEGIMPLVLENGKVEVSITNMELTASGTPLNDKLYEFINRRNNLEVRIDELDRREARLVMDGANIDEVRSQLRQEGEALVKEMNGYVKQFIIDNYENVLGPSVFIMMCSTMPYPMMTPQIEDIMRTAPLSFKEHPLVSDFLSKAHENMRLIEEQRRMQESINARQSAH